jgi:plasmid maintenance system antidote protein VapI
MNEKIHIGNLIQKKMEEDGRKVCWLAEKLHCSRNNIYQIYLRQSIDTDMLIRICIQLEINIFEQYSEYVKEQIQKKSGKL